MKVALRGVPAPATVTLNDQNFVAAGGEGAVYAVGELAVKVYEHPEHMIPEGKIAELAKIASPDILAPLGVVLHRDKPVGYVMKRAANCLPLPKVYPRAWRAANGLTPAAAMELVLALRRNFEHVHRGGCLVVDCNDMNFLAREDLSGVIHIDVDSYRTPHYPATAIVPFVRDPHWGKGGPTEHTDWYGFAVLTATLLVGLHPFKGRHPDYGPADVLERMREGASIFRPGVRLPKTCQPLAAIPARWADWYKEVFHSARRDVPPTTAEGADLTHVSVAIAAAAGDLIELRKLIDCPPGAPVVHFVRAEMGKLGSLLVALADGRFRTDAGRDLIGAGRPKKPPAALAVTPRGRRPVAFWPTDSRGRYMAWDLLANREIDLVTADQLVGSAGDLIHAQQGEDLSEISYIEGSAGVTRVLKERVGSVAPAAARLYPGVAVQPLLGAVYASVLPSRGRCCQVRLAEIEGGGNRVVDARFAGGRGREGETGVLEVVVARPSGEMDIHAWSGLEWSKGASRFRQHRVEEDVQGAELGTVELDSEVAVSVRVDGSTQLHRPGSGRYQSLRDDAVSSGRLFADAGRLLVGLDDGLYEAKMKP